STCVAAMAAASAGAVLGQTKEVKVGYGLAVNSHYGAAGQAWADAVGKGTNGAYQGKQVPASAPGGERGLMEGMQLCSEEVSRRGWGGVAGMAAASAGAVLGQTKEVKVGYAVAVNSHYGAAAQAWADAVENGTNGAYKFKQFPASALGGERELIEGLQLGTVE